MEKMEAKQVHLECPAPLVLLVRTYVTRTSPPPLRRKKLEIETKARNRCPMLENSLPYMGKGLGLMRGGEQFGKMT